ncbi:MAG: hypothetical protein A2341_15000 [Deltaproteobacteria bacterium RIFOXYB12_FULL_58_9]|nr:MAG: hypothetical protein A2341_15000 [Deltaproteobacteria bacterium RIFOXYB12_FULL_58_9]
MKPSILAIALGIACSAAICSPHRGALVVSDAELAGISDDDRATVEAKIKLLRTAESARTTKKAALIVGERELQIAELVVNRDKTALDIAELALQAAQETENADTMLPAKKAREDAGAQLDRTVANLEYAKASRDSLEQGVAVAEAEILVANAQLELAKFEAATSSKEGANATRLAEFKSQVAAAEADLAEVRVSAAKADAAMDAVRPEELATQQSETVSPATSPR